MWTGSAPRSLNDSQLTKKRCFEGARNGLLALACLHGVADGDDDLPGLCHPRKAVGRSPACLVVEPVAKHRRRKNPGESRPAADAPIEHGRRNRTEAEAVAGAGRDHDAVERRKQSRLIRDIGLEAERDAVADARGEEVGDIALEAALACFDVLEKRRLAGMAKRAAGMLFFFEHGDDVAIGDQRSISQTGRTGTDDGDALAARRLGIGEYRLAAGGAVDHAADARAAAHLVDASVA